jgi:hypothetical protein
MNSGLDWYRPSLVYVAIFVGALAAGAAPSCLTGQR